MEQKDVKNGQNRVGVSDTAEEIRARLLLEANDLPLSPGVYLMRDKNDKVIYVGKSKKLKNRVSLLVGHGPGLPDPHFHFFTVP